MHCKHLGTDKPLLGCLSDGYMSGSLIDIGAKSFQVFKQGPHTLYRGWTLFFKAGRDTFHLPPSGGGGNRANAPPCILCAGVPPRPGETPPGGPQGGPRTPPGFSHGPPGPWGL